MAFSGGGSNILKPHTHDSSILQDGGNLNFQNITQSNLSASSMTYSDGSHLQELILGDDASVLTVAGGIPSWSPHGDYPVMFLLDTYTGSNSQANLSWTAVDLATDYSEVIVIANMFTNDAAGMGGVYLFPNTLTGSVYSNPYGYSIDTSPAITALTVAETNRHRVGLAPLTSTNSGFHSETHISLAKTATTTNTVYMVTDSISNQNNSEHWENTMDLGTTELSSLRYQCSLASWATGSQISVYGVKSN